MPKRVPLPVTVVITFTARLDALDAFRRVLAGIKSDLLQVPGCAGLQVLSRLDDPCTFTLVETWHSAEAHRAHIDQVISSGAWDSIASHLAWEPSSAYYRQL